MKPGECERVQELTDLLKAAIVILGETRVHFRTGEVTRFEIIRQLEEFDAVLARKFVKSLIEPACKYRGDYEKRKS